MLSMAQLHGAPKLKARAAAFFNQHADAVMETDGWRELYKTTPALVQFVISQMAAGK
jgi:hypothetical protein